MAVRILLVDDEPRILDGLRRSLRGRYPVETAESGAAGLDLLAAEVGAAAPFAVVVSDMMMPGMNGAQFLIRARAILPDASFMILSGQADLTSTIAAVNQANLFRFLTKPVETGDLCSALDAALRQYELVTSERDLLEKTLRGAVDVLTEVLSLASPAAARRTGRVRLLVQAASDLLELTEDWRLPVASMLSQIGCLAVPHELLEQIETGGVLSGEEQRVYLGHPAVAHQMLAKIPRMEEIAAWVGAQPVGGRPATVAPVDSQELSAVVLGCSIALIEYLDGGKGVDEIGRRLAALGCWPQRVVDAVCAGSAVLQSQGSLRELTADRVRPGMVLQDDVVTTTGMVLLRKGERVTDVLTARLRNFALSVGVVEPIKVLVGAAGGEGDDDSGC